MATLWYRIIVDPSCKGLVLQLDCNLCFLFVYTAVCNPLCENGGECTAPGVCSCTSEWTGEYCQIGQQIVTMWLVCIFITKQDTTVYSDPCSCELQSWGRKGGEGREGEGGRGRKGGGGREVREGREERGGGRRGQMQTCMYKCTSFEFIQCQLALHRAVTTWIFYIKMIWL